MNNSWFAVDKEGLRKLLDGRSKTFVLFELIQNAWDEATRRVTVELAPHPTARGRATLVVTDDSPSGFADLTHAYTLYAESKKKSQADKRGRFNLGEKLVLALCDEAEVRSTTGGVRFCNDGTRQAITERTEAGSIFRATIRMTRAEYNEACEEARRLIVPADVETIFNGTPLPTRTPLKTIEATLPTEVADEEGVMRARTRKTTIAIYEAPDGAGALYEMGIPVVELDTMPYLVDVQQKIPLNQDRDNVRPAYYRTLCTTVLGAMHDALTTAHANDTWVSEAIADPAVPQEAVRAVITARFGEHAVIRDMADIEANAVASNAGYALVHGGSFSKEAWANIRAAEALKPAGAVFPTGKVQLGLSLLADGIGEPEGEIPQAAWTPGMRQVAALAQRMSVRLTGHAITVAMYNRLGPRVLAAYGSRQMLFAVHTLGKGFFEGWCGAIGPVVAIILHELAHEYESNHTDAAFYRALERMAGDTASIALREPTFFAPVELEAAA